MKTNVAACAAVLLAACASSGAKFSINQANQVKNGMTREEVIRAMGSKPYSITNQGKTFVWSYAKANGLTGSNESRAVKFSFDDDGKAYGIPDGGAYGDIDKYR